jgi:two-component system KDP operon response regulator KdpE
MTAAAATPPVHALVIDDEPQMQRLLSIALRSHGYHVAIAGTGDEAIAAIAHSRHEIVLLDLGLPDLDGVTVLKRIREWTQVPVIVLTVQDGEADKVEALDAGADDYVTKPFNTGELLARIRVALRHRSLGAAAEPVQRFGAVEVDLSRRLVKRDGQIVKLTATEYELLQLFVQHAGKVLTHQQVLRQVWGSDHAGETQYLRVYMARLREKLEQNPADPKLFATEPGVGYRLCE